MSKIAIFLYVLISLPVLALNACQFMENPRSNYSDFDELIYAIERGWLPEYFPRHATEITETHDIDTNEVHASFKFQEADLTKIASLCQELAVTESGSNYLCPSSDQRISVFTFKSNGKGYYWSRDSGI